ncbi:MAG: trigger factor, partial [Epsilonproteobacteria bacterium]
MDINATKINEANAQITATIMQDEINAKIDKIAKELAKTTSIAGFRKGKVPISAVKKQYGDRLVQDAEAEALREVLSSGLDELKIDNDLLIGEPQISKFDKVDGKIEVEVKVAMRPVIELGEYASHAAEFSKPNITEIAVTDRIQELAKAQAPFVTVEEDRELVDGDTALINFDGFVDGEPFEGGKAEDFSLTLGSAQFIPGFEEQVVGMKKGDEKEIGVTFPENYQGSLAGKPAIFKVKVNEIQMKEKVRMDTELAKKMIPGDENATMDMLKEQVQTQMENEELS